MKSSHTLTLRITTGDYWRLRRQAEQDEMKLTDLIRSFLSVGLQTEQLAPLETVKQGKRPRKR